MSPDIAWPDAGTLKDEVRDALKEIEAECAIIRNRRQNGGPRKLFRLWTYADLAGLYGEDDDWRCDGRVRRLITGRTARLWLQTEYHLWWKADEAGHDGLLFTCDPETGVDWDRNRAYDGAFRDAQYLRLTVANARTMVSGDRAIFRGVHQTSIRLMAAARQLESVPRPQVIGDGDAA